MQGVSRATMLSAMPVASVRAQAGVPRSPAVVPRGRVATPSLVAAPRRQATRALAITRTPLALRLRRSTTVRRPVAVQAMAASAEEVSGQVSPPSLSTLARATLRRR
jgi:hypothetical protein